MALNTLKYNRLILLGLKGLKLTHAKEAELKRRFVPCIHSCSQYRLAYCENINRIESLIRLKQFCVVNFPEQ